MTNLDHDELDDMLRRLIRLEAKVERHKEALTPYSVSLPGWSHGWALNWVRVHGRATAEIIAEYAYLDGLADGLAILQGREPSRPDPVGGGR